MQASLAVWSSEADVVRLLFLAEEAALARPFSDGHNLSGCEDLGANGPISLLRSGRAGRTRSRAGLVNSTHGDFKVTYIEWVN